MYHNVTYQRQTMHYKLSPYHHQQHNVYVHCGLQTRGIKLLSVTLLDLN